MKLKVIDKIFVGLGGAIMLALFVTSFYWVDWPNSCTPDFLRPFGGGEVCAQVITPTLHPSFYFSMDLLIVLVALYSAYLIFDASGITGNKNISRKKI